MAEMRQVKRREVAWSVQGPDAAAEDVEFPGMAELGEVLELRV